MKIAAGVATGLVALAAPLVAAAFAPTSEDERANALEVTAETPARIQRTTSWRAPRAGAIALDRLREAHGGTWRALWDADTGVPLRVYGAGIAVPGASLNAEAAARAAAELLDAHADLFAPGLGLGAFELVTNHFDAKANLRTVAFEQRHRGMAVRGGQLSVRIKKDRLIAFASEALPGIDAPAVTANGGKGVAPSVAADAATRWVAETAGEVAVREIHKAPFVLPVVDVRGRTTSHTVLEVEVDARAPFGRWSVFVDANTGALVAKKQTLMFASGTVQMNAPVRRPTSARRDWPAQFLSVSAGGQSLTTDAAGALTWPGDAPVEVSFQASGPDVDVDNDAGPQATFTGVLQPGGTVTWNAQDEEFVDAQINTFTASGIVKAYARELNPDLRWLTRALPATVNINDQCNAFSDGNSINFFQASRRCDNTGRLADVVYHEFGHSLHAQSIIRGAGSFDNALSEGAADYLSATITNDNGMGRGFFYTNAPLRDVDESRDRVWPDDAQNEPHQVGLIYAGAFWDLRKNLIAQMADDAEAVRITDDLWYQSLRRSGDIPSAYVEVLAADDDDGDLANGTPHICAINEAFARHGLADPTAVGPPISAPVLSGTELTVPVGEAPSECPGVTVTGMNVFWQVRGDDSQRGTVLLTDVGGGWSAALPELPPGTVLQYRIEVLLDDGSTQQMPTNPAAPFYETFIGEVVELYCTDFEEDPEANGWAHELLAGEQQEGADDWTWNELMSPVASGDPQSPYSGSRVIGNDLGGGNYNGRYQPNKQNAMYAPRIDTQGYPVVRLQYRRWLNVEDGDFDQATILSNGRMVWSNFATGNQGDTHHEDREWRFHDVDLSDTVRDNGVQVSFLLQSDGGLEFGGWTIDDLCVVGFLPPGQALCGNGTVEEGEACDDGNLVDGDGCESTCQFTPGVAVCGNGVVDEGEACDDGNVFQGDGCESDCTISPTAPGPMMPDCESNPALCEPDPVNPGLDGGNLDADQGCVSVRPGSQAPLGAVALLLGLMLVGRRRRR